jgi:hypothetical protein
MWEVVERVTVAATPSALFAVVRDFEQHPRLAGSGEVRSLTLDGPLAAGTTFRSEVSVGVVGSFVSTNRIDSVDEPRRVEWTSYPPLDDDETPDHQIEVHWWFALTPVGDGTELEHGFRVPVPRAGAEEFVAFLERTGRLDTARAGMVRTLANVKEDAERG